MKISILLTETFTTVEKPYFEFHSKSHITLKIKMFGRKIVTSLRSPNPNRAIQMKFAVSQYPANTSFPLSNLTETTRSGRCTPNGRPARVSYRKYTCGRYNKNSLAWGCLDKWTSCGMCIWTGAYNQSSLKVTNFMYPSCAPPRNHAQRVSHACKHTHRMFPVLRNSTDKKQGSSRPAKLLRNKGLGFKS